MTRRKSNVFQRLVELTAGAQQPWLAHGVVAHSELAVDGQPSACSFSDGPQQGVFSSAFIVLSPSRLQ
jgi:hypothetical protein